VRVRLSARQSELAKLQALTVGKLLSEKFEIDYLFRESLGDKNLTDPLWRMPEKGVFTEDFVNDLIQQKTDLVVHSWKDLPILDRPETEIVSTLPRADHRDMLLFKKASRSKKSVKIFSSSPRREFHLKDSLPTMIPDPVSKIEFLPVRGNIQTRIKKLIQDPQVDGLIVAKAAIDRLITQQHFAPTQEFVFTSLGQFEFMVIPTEICPSAAAQGALAIEVKKGVSDLVSFLIQNRDSETFECVQYERQILKAFGGGCHQKIGVHIRKLVGKYFVCVSGKTDAGESLEFRKLVRTVNVSEIVRDSKVAKPNQLPPWIFSSQELSAFTLRKKTESEWDSSLPTLVSKADALLDAKPPTGIVWASGLKTWQKLSQKGVWVNGSLEGLGEAELPKSFSWISGDLSWQKLTHGSRGDHSPSEEAAVKAIGTYQINLKSEWQSFFEKRKHECTHFFWTSGYYFNAAISRYPDLKDRIHACGPGNTLKALQAAAVSAKVCLSAIDLALDGDDKSG
jgi:hydroxymethylbilane synthase